MKMTGCTHLPGDHVDTDVILPADATVNAEPPVLAQDCSCGRCSSVRALVLS